MADDERPDHLLADGEFDIGRMMALTDGVFAIALTLLVLGIAVPDNLGNDKGRVGEEFWALWPQFAALALSFAVIGRYWIAHHQTFRTVDRCTMTLMWLNLLFLLPIVLMPFSSNFIADYGNLPLPTAVYAATVAAVALTHAAMAAYTRARIDPTLGTGGVEAGLVVGLFFLATVPLAFVAPDLTKYSWILLLFLPRLVGKVLDRRRARAARAGSVA